MERTLINNYKEKTFEEHQEHFIERLYERHGIQITPKEYQQLNNEYKGFFKRNASNSVGTVTIQDKKIWVMYSLTQHVIMTALPPEVETDIYHLIFACFPKDLRLLATKIYKQYEEEWENLPQFDNAHEAAEYCLNNTIFPSFHLAAYRKGEISIVKLLNVIKDILQDKSPQITLRVVRKK